MLRYCVFILYSQYRLTWRGLAPLGAALAAPVRLRDWGNIVQPYPASLRTHLDFFVAAPGTFSPRPRLLQLLRHSSIVKSVDEGWKLGSSLMEYSYCVKIESLLSQRVERKRRQLSWCGEGVCRPAQPFSTLPRFLANILLLGPRLRLLIAQYLGFGNWPACRLCPRLLRNVFAFGLFTCYRVFLRSFFCSMVTKYDW